MNLFIQGGTYFENNTLPLYLSNNITGVEEGITLFIRGSGTTPGATPYNKFMNLFLNRNEGAAISLFMLGQGTEYGTGVNFFIEGKTEFASGISLVMPDVIGVSSSGVNLTVIGF